VKEILRSLPRALHTKHDFLYQGRPLKEFKNAYKAACLRAELEDFTFHDLRHCAINKLRLPGNDFFRIMAMSGHKTMSVVKRYNLVTEDELRQVKWSASKESVDSYMDTMQCNKEKRSQQ
jgi:integrase